MLVGSRLCLASTLLFVGIAAAMPVFAAGHPGDVGDAWVKAVTASDLDAVAKLYAEDAVAWFPDEPEHQGAAAIRAAYKDMFDHFKINTATLTDRHAEGDGKHESHWGHFTMNVTQKSDGSWSLPYAGGTPLTIVLRPAGTPPPSEVPWSGILSSSRAIDWSHAGLPAALPDGETTPNPWTPPAVSVPRCNTPGSAISSSILCAAPAS